MGAMRRLAIVLALGVVGCSHVAQMTAADLAGRAQRNMIEAQQNLAGRPVIVRGVVQSTSLAARDQILVRGGWSYASATATVVQDQVPVVVLQPGSVYCYFEPRDMADAASLKVGDAVELKCEVDSFRPANDGAISVLSTCRRGDRW